MIRLPRLLGIASALTAVLLVSGCSSWDPSDIMDALSPAKKPLQGERKALFPEGTPGVQPGMPPDLVKGYQPQATPAPTQDADSDQGKPKAKPKPKPKVATAPPASAPAANATAAPASARPAASQSSSPWPDPPPTRQTAAPANGGQAVWPDPPATR
jgi:hypothetical protein